MAVAVLLGLLAGCTSDWDPSRKANVSTPDVVWSSGSISQAADMPQASRMPQIARKPQTARMPQAVGSRAPGEFASLPDRGELAVYDKRRKAQVHGAYTAYPVRLSEEHALNAAHAGGWMIVKAPDGETIELAYERHVEHPDGNWTWIGRDAKGADAVITFGAAATFGNLPETDGDTLRLTMAGGYAWLVVTDRSKIADINRAVTRAGKKDYLIPPKMASAATSDKATTAATAQAAPIAAAALVQTTVDVVVGYTVGLRDVLGGSSQAVTRINHLVDTANEAYANSAVNARLRLVGTVAVDYPDNTDNGDALEDLTGQTDSGPTTPHPALNPLRAMRNTYGADLVSLLRDFRTPENNGCGIAWLIGGGQSGIDQGDAPYGYSVVSDGSDTDGGDNYLCREESFAHELGHNMGQAHNVDDSSTSGVHAYSYGYREASSNGFYTVMAYSLGGNQFPITYFANPAISYDGRATGVANASDNARSLNLTMPIIATFRATVVPGEIAKRHDLNGDGRSDLLWRNPGTGQFAYWLMNGASIAGSATLAVSTSYTAIGTGDMDGNGLADIVWQNSGGQVYIWFGQSSGGFVSTFVYTLASSWKSAGTGDMNGDGKTDLLWRNAGTGQLAYWLMDGADITSSPSFAVSSSYTLVGIGDMDGNGRGDIAWRNSSGQVYLWLGQISGGFTYPFVYTLGFNWKPAGTGDMNADGKTDLLWRQTGTGQFAYWVMNGASIASAPSFAISSTYTLLDSGDMDGNGRGDLVWRNSSGQIYLWLGQASGGFTYPYVNTLNGWQPLP